MSASHEIAALIATIKASTAPVRYIAFEVTPGYRQPVVTFDGPDAEVQAARLWRRVHRSRDAFFRAIDTNGEVFGTKLRHEQHGLAGCLTEVCHDCGREFRTPRVGESLCPGCEALNADYQHDHL